MKHFVRHIILFLMIATVTGCYDEFMKEEIIGEGKASISATLDFKPMSSTLSRTRAAGDALKDISSLHVLLYDKDKNLKNKWKIEGYSESDENRTDKDAEANPNGEHHTAETTTKRATFKLPEEIDFGKYYMYAVANIPVFYLPESKSPKAEATDGEQEYTLTIKINGRDEPFVCKLPNLKALFRNTHVVVDITMYNSNEIIVDVIPYSEVNLEPEFGL